LIKGENNMMRALLVLAVVLLASGSVADAASPLGTAGPIRLFGWARCEAGPMAQFQGACDPEPVDQSLAPERRAKARIERAIGLLSVARLQQAKEELDAAIRDNPGDVAALTLRARAELPGDVALMTRLLNAALALAPNDADVLATRAFILFGDRDWDGAMRDVERALVIDFGNSDAHWVRGVVLEQRGKLDAAEHDFSHALLLDAGNFRARQFRGRLRLKANNPSGALEDAEVLLGVRPFDFEGLQIRAAARFRMKDFEGSVADLNKVLGEPGANTSASPVSARFNGLYIQRASALVSLGKIELAYKDIDRLVRTAGPRAVLRMQVYLRAHGFPGLAIDGQRSPMFDEALAKCLIDEVCGREIEAPFS
jgi:tetratricopeptide (TPR) repeat protein